jgi:hypothetical protein
MNHGNTRFVHRLETQANLLLHSGVIPFF